MRGSGASYESGS
ncbi:hypothetical protein ECEC1847_2265, partial [Escherichia coli EC1847]